MGSIDLFAQEENVLIVGGKYVTVVAIAFITCFLKTIRQMKEYAVYLLLDQNRFS